MHQERDACTSTSSIPFRPVGRNTQGEHRQLISTKVTRDRKSLKFNTPFPAPIPTNILSKHESQKELKKDIFISPESQGNIFPHEDGKKRNTYFSLIPPQHFLKTNQFSLRELSFGRYFPTFPLFRTHFRYCTLHLYMHVKIFYNSYVSTAEYSHSVDKDVLRASWIHSAVRNWGERSTGKWI